MKKTKKKTLSDMVNKIKILIQNILSKVSF